MYLEIYVFNWTNPNDIRNASIKRDFYEMGPYTFSEVHERTNMTWNPNDTITFYQKRTWQFVPEMSVGTLDDNVTFVNPIALVSLSKSYLYFNLIFLIDYLDGSLCNKTLWCRDKRTVEYYDECQTSTIECY